MATEPRPRPPEPSESERRASPLRLVEDVRERRAFRAALVIALLLHVLVLGLAAWIERRLPEATRTEEPRSVPFRFVEQQAEPAEVSPDTPVIAEADAEAQSPEAPDETPPETQAPRSEGPSPVREPPRAQASPQPPPPRPAETERQAEPEPQPREREPAIDPEAAKRRRVAEALDALRPSRPLSDLSDIPLDAPSIPDGTWGGGDLQFESRADVDWGPYARELRRIVRSNWRIPNAAKAGFDGVVQVHFAIRRDGEVRDLEIVRESGTVPLDVAARDAIALSSSFPPPPLPEDSDEESVGVTWTFFYNIDGREMRLWRRQQRLAR